ncbi:hypothetical protein CWC15_19585 [Pseudoalteromonas spongiae]|nr:hypothetical protein CWC15_19585 [Pseudoalteromonas spongiae]
MNAVKQDKPNKKHFLFGLLNGLFVFHCDTSKLSELDKGKVIELPGSSSIKPRMNKEKENEHYYLKNAI